MSEERNLPIEVAGHAVVRHTVFLVLNQYAMTQQLGKVFMKTVYDMENPDNRDRGIGSRTPDVMFIEANSLADYKSKTPDWKGRPYAIVPDLVIEVVSPNDKYSHIDAKVDLYLADGVRVVWVIDPQQRKVSVHTSDREDPHVLKGNAVLKGGDVLPTFEIALTKLFES